MLGRKFFKQYVNNNSLFIFIVFVFVLSLIEAMTSDQGVWGDLQYLRRLAKPSETLVGASAGGNCKEAFFKLWASQSQ